MFKRKGFTLIELVMIIVILGILAAVAIPRYINLAEEARDAAEAGVVGGVRGGIHSYFAENRAWPATLDDTPDGNCSTANPCFDNVLAAGGITNTNWSKAGLVYTGPGGGTATYVPATGELTYAPAL